MQDVVLQQLLALNECLTVFALLLVLLNVSVMLAREIVVATDDILDASQ